MALEAKGRGGIWGGGYNGEELKANEQASNKFRLHRFR